MSTLVFADKTLMIVEQIQGELPDLVGAEGWAAIQDEFNEKVQQLRDPAAEKRTLVATEIPKLLWDYPEARARFDAEMDKLDIYRGTLDMLGDMASSLGADQHIRQGIDAAATVKRTRFVAISADDIGEATSIKLKNIKFEFGEFGALASGAVLGVKEIVNETHPIFLAAGVIAIAASLYSAMRKEIGEQEAKVLWGFIQAADAHHEAHIDAIVEHTNAELEKRQLTPLTKGQITESLMRLGRIHTIEPVEDKPGYWHIIERFLVKE